MPALWRRLRDHLDLSAPTVGGETLGRDRGALARLHGRRGDPPARPSGLAEGGDRDPHRQPRAAGRRHQARGRDARAVQLEGPAVVFNSLDDLAKRIDDPALDVTPSHCMVLRNAGPIGAPGMPEAGALPIPKKLGAKGLTDMVRISDARMSGTAFGTVVLHVTPEASAGGPLALVRDGDRIRLDAIARARSISWSTRPSSRAAARSGSRRRSPRAATAGSTSSASPRPTRAAISISWPEPDLGGSRCSAPSPRSRSAARWSTS